MTRTLAALIATALSLVLSLSAFAAPPKVPVQGVLTDPDGAAIEGSLDVVFTLYPSADDPTVLWSETQAVAFTRGVFAVYLGAVTPLDPSVFDENRAVWLGVAVDGDAEMDRIEIATAPYAAYAAYAGDAETVGGQGPEAFATAAHRHGWDELDGVPPALADGDADTTYDAAPGGGIALAGTVFGLVPCGEGQVLKFTGGAWGCAADSIGDADAATLSAAALEGTELVLTEGGRTLRVDLGALGPDADADPMNELLQSAALNGAVLELTDAGGTARVDLGALADGDGDPTNELLQDGALDGTTLRLVDAGGEVAIDLSSLATDGDSDPLNEVLRAAALNGTILELSDAGGTVSVDLGALVADGDADPVNEALTDAVLEGATLVLTEGGRTLRVDLSPIATDGDADATNELIGGLRLDGTMLVVSEAGVDHTVELGGLVDDADADPANELIGGLRLDGNRLVITEAGIEQGVDLAALVADADADPRNELLTGAALAGTVLTLTDAGGDRRVDLAALVNDADADPRNELLQNASLLGTRLQLTDAGGTREVELVSLVNDADADPRNELLTGAGLAGTVLTLTDAGGQRQVDLASLVNDADADPNNEIQTLSIAANGDLALSRANTVNIYNQAYTVSANLGRSADDIVFPVGLNDDDATADVNLPFSVTYQGVAYNRVRISTNGWIEFGNSASDSDLGNRCLPATLHSGPFVAAYWDDLVSSIRWGTEGTAPNRVFAAYFDSATFTGNNNINFTVQIHEGSGLINVRYNAMAPAAIGQSATIGFQGAGAQNAKAYPLGCNVAVIDDNADDGDPGEQGWSVAPLR